MRQTLLGGQRDRAPATTRAKSRNRKGQSQISPWMLAGLCHTWRLRYTEPHLSSQQCGNEIRGCFQKQWGYAICCFVPDDTRAVKDPGSGHDRGIASEEEFNAEVSMRNDGLSLCVDPGRTPWFLSLKTCQKEQIPGLRCCSQLMPSIPCFFGPLATSRKGSS